MTIEELIGAWQAGDKGARERLFRIIYADMSSIASALLRRESRTVSLATGDLVSESVIRLLKSEVLQIHDRAHLLALFAKVMRQVLIDLAKAKGRKKRDGLRVYLSEIEDEQQISEVDVIGLERALQRLYEIDPRRATVAELKHYGGMTVEEIAIVMQTAPATVKRTWRAARLWLRKAIDESA